MRRSLVLAAAGVILLTGCRTINVAGEVGSGTPRSEDRSISGATEVHATASVVTRVTIGEPASVRVTADDNLLDNVTTRVVGSRLEIGIHGGVSTRTPVTVTVVLPAVEAASATASARVELMDVTSDALDVRADASGVVMVTGQTGELHATATSAGRLELGQLSATRAEVRLDSAATAWVLAVDRITGDVSTAAVLTVIGDPGSVDVTTNTAGRVVRD